MTTSLLSFSLGRIVATPAALDALEHSGITETAMLRFHAAGSWGNVCPEDARANDRAVVHGDRILSAYDTPLGKTVWIITEADRSATTLLLPDDY